MIIYKESIKKQNDETWGQIPVPMFFSCEATKIHGSHGRHGFLALVLRKRSHRNQSSEFRRNFGQIIIQSCLLHATFSCGTKVCNFTVTCEVVVQHEVIHLRLHLCGGKLRVIDKSVAIADFGIEHLASAHCLVRLDEVNDIVRHLIVASPWNVLHLVVDDDWCDVVLLHKGFTCLGSEGCGGVGTGDGMDGCKC